MPSEDLSGAQVFMFVIIFLIIIAGICLLVYVKPSCNKPPKGSKKCESYTRENITCPSDTIDNDTYQYVALKDCWANLTDGAENRYQLKNEIGNAYSKTWDKIYPEICDEV